MRRSVVFVIAVCVILGGCGHHAQENIVPTAGSVEAPTPQTTMSATTAPTSTTIPTPTPIHEETSAATDTDEVSAVKEPDYAVYLGNWIDSDTAMTRDEVFDQGGSAIQFEQIDGMHVVGNAISVSESMGHRDARVDFEGDIVADRLDIVYDQDGWDNFGTISIRFEQSRLVVNMESYETNDYANWNIGFGEYIFTPEIIGS